LILPPGHETIFRNRHLIGRVLNGLFHVGATAVSGVYCPGLITALVLYAPLFWYLSQIAYREHLLTNTLGVVAFLIAAVIHTMDVAASVFGVKLQSDRHTT